MPREWELSVEAPEIGVTKTLLVTGDMMIGEIIVKLATAFGPQDWSDHGLWWPERSVWLRRPRITLQAYGIESDSKVQFTAQNKPLCVKLPDRTVVRMKVNLSSECFHAVEQVCKSIGIRRFEELSFMRCANPGGPPNIALQYYSSKKTAVHSHLEPGRDHTSDGCIQGAEYVVSGGSAGLIVRSDSVPDHTFMDQMVSTTHDRAFLNGLWFDSSKSLYSQGVKEGDFIQLKFKYFTFLDLDPQVDRLRIGHLFEQAHWSVVLEDVDCTEEEAISFAALQLQTILARKRPDLGQQAQPAEDSSDLEAALNDLQVSLGTQSAAAAAPSVMVARKVDGHLKIAKGSRLLGKQKVGYFVFQECSLLQYSNPSMGGGQIGRYNFRGAVITPDVDPDKGKYTIRAEVDDSGSSTEIRLTAESEEEFAMWLAACRMASRGKAAGSAGFESEKEACGVFVSMLTPLKKAEEGKRTLASFLPQALIKKRNIKQLASSILDAHASVAGQALLESKLNYVRAWEALQDFGVSYFLVNFTIPGRSKEELLGVAYNRLIRLDANTHAHLQTWRYSTMRSWNINWEIKELKIEHEDGPIAFTCRSADLKILHEFIGGYIFMSMRKDVHETVNSEMFYKLTGGWEG
eukprot:scpid28254/ scgid18455/ Fermitin family homolog 1; Kindlerin; Kindlin syndrome protein; Kindlin-1; Unc-112-related protein 1